MGGRSSRRSSVLASARRSGDVSCDICGFRGCVRGRLVLQARPCCGAESLPCHVDGSHADQQSGHLLFRQLGQDLAFGGARQRRECSGGFGFDLAPSTTSREVGYLAWTWRARHCWGCASSTPCEPSAFRVITYFAHCEPGSRAGLLSRSRPTPRLRRSEEILAVRRS